MNSKDFQLAALAFNKNITMIAVDCFQLVGFGKLNHYCKNVLLKLAAYHFSGVIFAFVQTLF